MTTNQHGRVSVIIPARNEEINIGRVVRSIANQSDLREIFVVDDQSEDRTAQVLAELKAAVPLLQILRADCLPKGWMGKTHAVAQGAAAATGEWLLFTDADTEHLDGSLAALLQRAEKEHVDLLSLSPGQETPTWWEKAVIPLVFVKLAVLFRFEEVNDPRSTAAAANGQYILVRRDIYQRSGGHEAVKSAILEDVELARRVKSQGGKLLFLPGAQWVRTRMYRTFGEMWQGWTKNLFLLYGGDNSPMLRTVASLWLLDVFPELAFVALCVWSLSAHLGAPAVLAAVILFALSLGRQWSYGHDLEKLGFDPALANYQPIGASLLGVLMLGSLRAHRSTGRIRWKGRQYTTKGRQ